MKLSAQSRRTRVIGVRVILGFCLLVTAVCAGRGFAQDHWPQEFAIREGKISVYQPQLDSYKGDIITGRAALALQKKSAKEPVFGVVWFSARALMDREARMVEFRNIVVERIKFPRSTPDQEREWEDVLTKVSGKWMPTHIALDRLLALTAAVEKGKMPTDRLNMEPPKIIFTTAPSVLILINGQPQLRAVENSMLERVMNTPFLILFDPAAGTYYTKGETAWYSAPAVMGPWRGLDGPPPPAVVEVAGRIMEPGERVGDDGTGPKVAPRIIVATEPTELIVSEGQPQFAPVQGTELLYLKNTPNEVFMEIRSQQYYVLLAGRWYRSRSLENGPWTYVPADNLPGAFKKIPPGSPKGHILAFVAGTREAEEAVRDAQIPQTIAVKRNEAKLMVTYDGEPRFEPVRGTGLHYAVNTKTQVVKVDERYYAVDQAVWFVADSPTGPWVVADSIPPEIETLPPDSPVYNMKFVRIYGSTPEVVYVGYTPGYLGSYIYGDTIVYGTGYSYPGWFGTAYYPAPVTWGFSPVYDPYYCSWGFGWGYGAGFYSGFSWGFPMGVVVSPWWYGCLWAGWYPWYGYGYGYTWHDGHHHHHDGHGHPWHSKYADHRRYPPHGDRHSSGYRNSPGSRPHADIHRPIYTAGRTASGPGWSGSGRVPGAYGGKPGVTSPRSGQDASRPRGSFAGTWDRITNRRQNDLYAGQDGTVYRRTFRGWEQRTSSGWARPETRPQTSLHFDQYRSRLDRDYRDRMSGGGRTGDFGRTTGGYSRGTNPGRGWTGRSFGIPGPGSSGGSAVRGVRGGGDGGPKGGGSPRVGLPGGFGGAHGNDGSIGGGSRGGGFSRGSFGGAYGSGGPRGGSPPSGGFSGGSHGRGGRGSGSRR